MQDDALRQETIARLRAGLADGLPDQVAARAEQVLARLGSGVRLFLLGPQGGGKSTLANALLGTDLPNAPADHIARVIAGADAPDVGGMAETAPGAVMQLSCASPLLQMAQVIDVAGSADPAEHAVRIGWALSQADIVLWCAPGVSAQDVALWQDAPDALKDHSFLVLTKADVLAGNQTLAPRMQEMQIVASEEFHSLCPTTAAGLAAAISSGAQPDDTERAASGVKALYDSVLSLAASGQQADLDGALLFIDRHGLPEVAAGPQTTGATGASRAARAQTYARARDLLTARGNEIGAMASADPDAAAAPLLELCGTLAEDLVDVAEDAPTADPELDAWRDDLAAASDKIVLMGLENDVRSAADAVTIILQLGRDLHARALH